MIKVPWVEQLADFGAGHDDQLSALTARVVAGATSMATTSCPPNRLASRRAMNIGAGVNGAIKTPSAPARSAVGLVGFEAASLRALRLGAV